VTGNEKYPKLERQPLTLVLAEFRFSPVNNPADCIPDFAKAAGLQQGGFEEGARQEVQLSSEGVSVKTPNKIWMFRDAKQGRLIQVEKDRMIFVTTQYPRFEAFAAQCMEVVYALKQAMEPERLLRVGLRYNDAVVPCEDESLSQYLDPQLLPAAVLAESDAFVEHHRTETLVRTHAGVLALRLLMGRHGLAVMPDIGHRFPLALSMEVPAERMTAVLDFDHFWKPDREDSAEFSSDEAENRLRALHEAAREAFWKVTTEFARRERWA
jgi:uncharacterized protein (TIGR04255 family)